MNNKKTSTRKLRRIALTALALLTSLTFTVATGMYINQDKLSDLYGRGKKTVVALGDAAQGDAVYYTQLYPDTAAAKEAGYAVSRQISDEGIVLLKNEGLLPLPADSSLSPFGLRYRLPYYGGKGSGAVSANEDNVVSPARGLEEAFTLINNQVTGCMDRALAGGSLADNANVRAARPLQSGQEAHILYEFDADIYKGAEQSCQGTVGVVFIGRQTGEDIDACTTAYDDGTPHMLALTEVERRTLSFAKSSCKAVVVVLAASSPMELGELQDDDGIGAILWVGGTGSSGYASLGRVLNGEVVPSGRVTDTYPADFKADPTFANQDDGSENFVYSNAYTTLVTNFDWEEKAPTPFREYEEGVYLGYKYYETAYDTGHLNDYYNRQNGVVYPFGFGLSYTAFDQKISAFTDQNGNVSLTVRVTNRGRQYAGKDVVQVYARAPYTEFDQQYRIEKPTAVLMDFAKTGLIPPGGYEDVRLSFSRENMASYCYTRNNGDGTTGCYVLEQGDYTVSLRANAHDILEERTVAVEQTIWYDANTPRQSEWLAQAQWDDSGIADSSLWRGADVFYAATNQFEQLNQYMSDAAVSEAVVLSRGNWQATQPTAPQGRDRTASDTVVGWVAESDTLTADYRTNPVLGNQPTSAVYRPDAPLSRAANRLVLADLRGRQYDDTLWDMLLDQLDLHDVDALRQCLFEDAYKTGALDSIGKPPSAEYDGPQGLTMTDLSGHNWIEGTCAYPSAPVMAATWNRQLVYDFGYAVGQEALLRGISGLYAPGLNLHRSPFAGRVAEYFSEDPLLAGEMGAQVLSGGGDTGLYCAVKHFALMNTENHRNPHSTVWLTEQALREVYLRPFEIALKNATKTIRYRGEDGQLVNKNMCAGDFIMAADCAIGPLWSAANYNLLTGVVRQEWGFQGAVISDMHLLSNGNQINTMVRAGCDVLMATAPGPDLSGLDVETPTGQYALRRAVKNLCYAQVNSALMQNVAPGSVVRQSMPGWVMWLWVSIAVTAALDVGVCVWLAVRGQDERKYPEKYEE